ncbi:Predicted arabinose efflux permease, MFS family [Micromonospora echinaurantiaca]|uniref:Predicted arabinose efflux permease, MFS family n=1 Tax=Micromonospora echinaurantiaca TaxID=47857 RepID=A0A1C5HQK6_9ACTN|nr:MFS transporter [Micromonospora echinaurantiaca]SCG48284.1 Predicted arabinose efflux permease, MFS family [Micromonospora echinaurantiaca]
MNLPGRAVAVIVLMNLAQLPVAMRQLLVVLLGHHNTGSFAAAGAASAACGLGLAVSAPLYGRLLPRLGDRVVLLGSGLAHLAALSGLALSTRPAAFVALAAAAGLATPPALSSGRSLLPRLVPATALTRAYAVNAVGQELLYVGGPLAVTLSLLLTGPAGAMLAFAAVGSLALVGNALVVPRRDAAGAADRPARPATRRTVRTLLGVHLGYATCMGAMWVLVPAFAAGAGHPNQAGVLITVWSVGSLAGGLVLARRGRLGDPRRAYLALLATMALTSAALPWPRTVPQMAVALAVFGLALAPWLAVTDGLMARAAPAPHTAEAYGWLQTVGQLGTALGAASSGAVSDRFGTTPAFLIVSGALAIAVAVALTRRRWLPAAPDATPAGPPVPERDVSVPDGRVAG